MTIRNISPALLLLPLLLLLLQPHYSVQQGCNCVDCKDVIEGPYSGSYYSMGVPSLTGGCLYRNRLNGKIIRACDQETSLSDAHEYNVCDLASGPQECVDPPDYADFGYTSRIWDGTKILLSRVSYYCEPPKMIESYNGSANYDIWCSAAEFPAWQFTLPDNNLPLCS
eukprot:GFUD01016550.1.p1 GENE.GFUD01016550.1~~GFUD01016550.1.p1  ORF type:complete len:175 (-),score=34.22 GFUD01016550.1:24-527(-)